MKVSSSSPADEMQRKLSQHDNKHSIAHKRIVGQPVPPIAWRVLEASMQTLSQCEVYHPHPLPPDSQQQTLPPNFSVNSNILN
jgi:hypothetical protein